MYESLVGRHYFQETHIRLIKQSDGPQAKGPSCEAIIRAARLHQKSGSLDQLIAGLSFRLSLGREFLRSLDWSDDEQWNVALGFPGGIAGLWVPQGASVPHALADLSLTVAVLFLRDFDVIERDHSAYMRASIGIVSGLCWEFGEVTQRGLEVDEFYASGLFGASNRQTA